MAAANNTLQLGTVPAGGYARGHVRPRWKAISAISLGATLFVSCTVAMLRGAEPFATSYYIFAWYATLLVLYGVLGLTAGRSPSLRRPASLATMLGWSVVVWLFFELLNFRLQNWYYVFVPADGVIRWIAITISFATVLPAVFGAEALLDGLGVMEKTRWRRMRVTPVLLRRMRIAGVIMLVLPMLWPKVFFPLVWGAVTCLVEPSVYEKDRTRSLLHDLELGQPGRMLRVLLGGAAIGFLWELFNFEARGKWIYTVPFFENLKLFEMPLLGFLGFPPFAIDCFVVWQWLVLAGVAVPLSGRALPATRARRLASAGVACVFSIAVLYVMEDRTISSYTPRLADVRSIPAAAELQRAGFDVFTLAKAEPSYAAALAGVPRDDVAAAIQAARVIRLRGIGTRNAELLARAGVHSVEDLAAQDPKQLAARLRQVSGHDVVDARVRLWVRAARQDAIQPIRS